MRSGPCHDKEPWFGELWWTFATVAIWMLVQQLVGIIPQDQWEIVIRIGAIVSPQSWLVHARIVFDEGVVVVARIAFQPQPVVPANGHTCFHVAFVMIVLVQILAQKGRGVTRRLRMDRKGMVGFRVRLPIFAVAVARDAVVVRQVAVVQVSSRENTASGRTTDGRVDKGVFKGQALFLEVFLDLWHVIEGTQLDILVVGDQQQNVGAFRCICS